MIEEKTLLDQLDELFVYGLNSRVCGRLLVRKDNGEDILYLAGFYGLGDDPDKERVLYAVWQTGSIDVYRITEETLELHFDMSYVPYGGKRILNLSFDSEDKDGELVRVSCLPTMFVPSE